MARTPDDELERLKQDVALERLAEARGIKLKRHGSESSAAGSTPTCKRSWSGRKSKATARTP